MCLMSIKLFAFLVYAAGMLSLMGAMIVVARRQRRATDATAHARARRNPPLEFTPVGGAPGTFVMPIVNVPADHEPESPALPTDSSVPWSTLVEETNERQRQAAIAARHDQGVPPHPYRRRKR